MSDTTSGSGEYFLLEKKISDFFFSIPHLEKSEIEPTAKCTGAGSVLMVNKTDGQLSFETTGASYIHEPMNNKLLQFN